VEYIVKEKIYIFLIIYNINIRIILIIHDVKYMLQIIIEF